MPAWIAYLACLIGVLGHASSEFVAKLAATPGPEFRVWRFLIGGAFLVIVTQFWPGARDLITPLRENGLRIALLSCLGMALGQLIFHWALDFADVVQVATIVTGIPIAVVVVDRLINGTPMTAPKMVSGIGAFIGPTLVAGAMDLWGPKGFFWSLASIHVGLGVFILYRMTQRAALPAEEQGIYGAMPARATLVAGEMYGEAATEAGEATISNEEPVDTHKLNERKVPCGPEIVLPGSR